MVPLSWLLSAELHRTHNQRASTQGSKKPHVARGGTHRFISVVKLPKLAGIEPPNWLPLR